MRWKLLEGKNINLRLVEKSELPILAEWSNNLEFLGQYVWLQQQSVAEWEKRYDSLTPDIKWFFIEKKDGTKIGTMFHWPAEYAFEIGYVLVPNERRKGYCTEAVKIIVDYLFLSRNIVRIQALTDAENMASQRVLGKVGFKKEGTIRKSGFTRGEWRDRCLFSILREEWKRQKH